MPTTAELFDTPLTTISDFTECRYDPMHEVREATASPTPLSEMLQDPAILRSLIGHKKKRRGSNASMHRAHNPDHSHPKERDSSVPGAAPPPAPPKDRDRETRRKERERDRDTETASILTLVLAEEERQAHHLKAVLRTTGDRLESEMRRAEQAESRARSAEARARDASHRASTAETGRHQVELECVRAREEVARWRMQAEAAEREARRAEAQVARLERVRDDAERGATEAKEAARKAQHALREWQAREEGREEGRLLEARRRWNNGREEGFEDGRAEGFEAGHAEGFEEGREEGFSHGRVEGYNAGRLAGFEEGRKVGWLEGVEEGMERGRKEERVYALNAFDRFVASEIEHKSTTSAGTKEEDRTQRWVDSTRQSSSPRTVREPSPQPKPVWLHRRLNTPEPSRAMSPVPAVE